MRRINELNDEIYVFFPTTTQQKNVEKTIQTACQSL